MSRHEIITFIYLEAWNEHVYYEYSLCRNLDSAFPHIWAKPHSQWQCRQMPKLEEVLTLNPIQWGTPYRSTMVMAGIMEIKGNRIYSFMFIRMDDIVRLQDRLENLEGPIYVWDHGQKWQSQISQETRIYSSLNQSKITPDQLKWILNWYVEKQVMKISNLHQEKSTTTPHI